MGIFVFLPLVLPLTTWPVAALAGQRLHPRAATWLLSVVAAMLAVCSTVCLALLMVVGTAQLPGNPLPDGWSDEEVREAVPYDGAAGGAAIPALLTVLAACLRTGWRHHRVRLRSGHALAGLPAGPLAVLPDRVPYAYALPGGWREGSGRIVVSTAMLSRLERVERRALLAHEQAHLTHRHHRFLLVVRLAARANPFLLPLCRTVAYAVERWADEEAAGVVGSRRATARAIGKAALDSRGAPVATLAGLAAPGPVPRRVAALLAPAPVEGRWPPLGTAAGAAAWTAAAGTVLSAMSSANSAVTLFTVLEATTPL